MFKESVREETNTQEGRKERDGAGGADRSERVSWGMRWIKRKIFLCLHVAWGYRTPVNKRMTFALTQSVSAAPERKGLFDLAPAFLLAKPLSSPPPVSTERMMWGVGDDEVLSRWIEQRHRFSFPSAGRELAATPTGELNCTLAALNWWRLSVDDFRRSNDENQLSEWRSIRCSKRAGNRWFQSACFARPSKQKTDACL